MNLAKTRMGGALARFRPAAFPYARFALALFIGACGGGLFVWAHLPLPWMLGAMVACTAAALLKLKVAAPPVIRPPMLMVIGVMMGASFTPQLFLQFGAWWPATLALLAFLLLSGGSSVWYFRHVVGLDHSTAFFSGMPGGLVEMIERGQEQGGDGRTIALVHSVRILLIVMTLPFVVQWMTGASVNRTGGQASAFDTPLSSEVLLLCCGLLGMALGHVLRLPAKYLFGPLLTSAVVHAAGWSDLRPPYEVVNFAQLILGVVIGCRFVGSSAGTVLRIIRLSLGSTLILMAWTLLFAVLVGRWVAIEPVTVLLAFSPGGLAEMSLVALALHAEVAFVTLHHIVRLMLVMLLAAPLFNALYGRAGAATPGRPVLNPSLKGNPDDQRQRDRH